MTERGPTRLARIAQFVWLGLAVCAIAIGAEGSSGLVPICHSTSTCASTGGLSASAVRTLSHDGVSIAAFTVLIDAIFAAVLAIWLCVGALIVWRKPGDRGAVLAAYFLVVFPLLFAAPIPSTGGFHVILLVLILFALLFPDGRFVPRWTRWLGLIAILDAAGSILLAPAVGFVLVLLVLPAVVAQVYRYRTISSWAQRQQTKWAMLGLAAGILGFIGLALLQAIFKGTETSNGAILSFVWSTLSFPIVVSAIPVSIGLSVLRSRLWDIDRIVSRALAYVTLTLTLGTIYVGGVIGLQALIGLAAGNSSGPAIVLSTLAVAALFGPLRRRIQTGIDRRFYRNKYDAARTLASLGEQLRDEVDLRQLCHDLTSVVHDALHPAHVSLWLREGPTNAAVDSH